MYSESSIGYRERNIIRTFEYHKPGDGMQGDGDCGLYALCAAMGGGVVSADAFMTDVLRELGLSERPNYAWSDDELAAIAHHYGHDAYVYDETDGTGIVFGHGDRPAAVLYNVDGDSRWTPGVRTLMPSAARAPRRLAVVDNASRVDGLDVIGHRVRSQAEADEVAAAAAAAAAEEVAAATRRTGLYASIGDAIASKARNGMRGWQMLRGAVMKNFGKVNDAVRRYRDESRNARIAAAKTKYKCGCGCGRGRRLWWPWDAGTSAANNAAALADEADLAASEAVIMALLGVTAPAAVGSEAATVAGEEAAAVAGEEAAVAGEEAAAVAGEEAAAVAGEEAAAGSAVAAAGAREPTAGEKRDDAVASKRDSDKETMV